MIKLDEIGEKGTEAVRKLRRRKLQDGLPFMINSRDLVSNQCYLEYPNGIILLVTFKSAARDLNVIRELSPLEANNLRARFKFYL